MKFFLLTFLLLCMWRSGQSEGNISNDSGSVPDDSLFMETTKAFKVYAADVNDYTRSNKELETLNNWNDILQQKMVIIQRELEQQMDIFNQLDEKVSTLPQKLEGMLQKHLKEIDFENHFQALSDRIANKLSNIEDNLIPKADQLKFYEDIEQCCTKIDDNKVCNKTDNPNLTSPPTSCADYDATYCADNKCNITNVLHEPKQFIVFCDNSVDGGGWIVIQRRIDGSVDFYRNWSEYKNGFGNIDGEFFIGLDKLHALTRTLKPMELLIQLEDFYNVLKYAKYDDFQIGDETQKYRLNKLGSYTGDAGDSLRYHVGSYFTTKDRDNDANFKDNCAVLFTGAWWYNFCFQSNLNGKYNKRLSADSNGINWYTFHKFGNLKFVQMLIRPRKENTKYSTIQQ